MADREKKHKQGGKRDRHGKGGDGGGRARKRKAKQKARRLERKERKELRRDATADANLAYGEPLRGVQSEIGRAQLHQQALAQAFDRYQQQISELGAAAQMNVQNAIGSRAAMEQGLQGMATDFASRLQGGAAAQAQALGQTGVGVEQVGQTAAGAGVANAQQAMLETGSMANIGLANTADFARRAAIAGQDQIGANQEMENYIREQVAKQIALTAERDQSIVQGMRDYRQQGEENEIARESLNLDKKAQRLDKRAQKANERDDRADNREARKERRQEKRENALDRQHDSVEAAKDRRADRKESRRDRRHDGRQNRHDGGAGSSGSGGGGLSPSERQEAKGQIKDVDAAIDAYISGRRRGLSEGQAGSKARKQIGAERWEVRLARDLEDGRLSRKGRTVLKSKLPAGAKIPKKYR